MAHGGGATGITATCGRGRRAVTRSNGDPDTGNFVLQYGWRPTELRRVLEPTRALRAPECPRADLRFCVLHQYGDRAADDLGATSG